MFPAVHGRWRAAIWTAVLVAAPAAASNQDSPHPRPGDVEAAAGSLAAALLDSSWSKLRPPLTTDAEQARSVDPVLTGNAAIWIHDNLPLPPLTVVGGRVFSYRDVDYDPIEAPVLKLRAIDDDQVVPFLVRTVLDFDRPPSAEAAVVVSFPAPPIFASTIAELSAWVDHQRSHVWVNTSLSDARIDVRVPLARTNGIGRQKSDAPITVIIEGELVLGPYRPLSPGRFADLEIHALEPSVAELARLEVDRDVANATEREQLQEIAATLVSRTRTSYDRVLAVNSWVGDRLQYRESLAMRSAAEALVDRSGDCDEHTALAVALLRAMSIPARRARGLLYNLDSLSPHTWAEVALPNRNGGLHWFIVDPTLAGTTPLEEEKAAFVQYRDRVLFYPMKPTTSVVDTAGRHTTDLLLNWRKANQGRMNDPSRLDRFVTLAVGRVDNEISRGAERLAEADLMLSRESASIAGSPYLLVDRPVADGHSSRLQLRLENEERLLLDLVAEGGSFLESESDLETIDRLRAVYRDLNGVFFDGGPAHRNLELFFTRDRHSDRLHTVSLRFGRYLVESVLDRILKRLSKGGFLTEEETARIEAVAEASGGKNLYLLQELARQLPADE